MERTVKITAPEGLHARSTALLVSAATPLNSSNGTKWVETILSYEANRNNLLGCLNVPK